MEEELSEESDAAISSQAWQFFFNSADCLDVFAQSFIFFFRERVFVRFHCACEGISIVFAHGITGSVLVHKTKGFVPCIFVISKKLVFLLVKVVQFFVQLVCAASSVVEEDSCFVFVLFVEEELPQPVNAKSTEMARDAAITVFNFIEFVLSVLFS